MQTIALGIGVEIKFLAKNTLLHKAFIKVLTKLNHLVLRSIQVAWLCSWIFWIFMRFFIFFSLKKLEKSECFNWWKMELKPNMLSSLVFLLTWMMLKVHSAHNSMPVFCPSIQWWHEMTCQIDLRAEQDRQHCHRIRPSILPLLLFKSFINLPGWRHRAKDKFRAVMSS